MHSHKLKLNSNVLDHEDSESEREHQYDQTISKYVSRQNIGSLEKQMLRLREDYLSNRTSNEEWYQMEIKRLYRLYKDSNNK